MNLKYPLGSETVTAGTFLLSQTNKHPCTQHPRQSRQKNASEASNFLQLGLRIWLQSVYVGDISYRSIGVFLLLNYSVFVSLVCIELGDVHMYLILFVLWLVFNGRITLEVCLLGLVVAGLIFAFTCRFLGHSLKKERRLFSNVGYMLLYAVTMVIEVVKATARVLHIVLDKGIVVHQTMVKVNVNLKSNFSRVMLANSITLTPGTITVAVKDSEYTVHCLSREMIDGIETSRFVKLLQKMEA